MKILLATDGSRHSRSAVDLLTQTPFAAPGNEVGVLVVLPAAKPAARTAPREAAEKLARGTAQRLQYVGCAAHTVLREGHVARCIVETAEEFGAELVVVGSRGLCGARRFRTGQVSQKTMQRAPCSVLVIRQPEERATAQGTNEGSALRILVAFDGSESARAAVEALAALPLPDDTEITIVTALPLITCFGTDILQTASPEWRKRTKTALADLESAANLLRRATPHVDTALRQGRDETEEILTLAGELDADMIVLGHKGKSTIKRVLLGSVSAQVTHHARCSVWVVRRPSRPSRQN